MINGMPAQSVTQRNAIAVDGLSDGSPKQPSEPPGMAPEEFGVLRNGQKARGHFRRAFLSPRSQEKQLPVFVGVFVTGEAAFRPRERSIVDQRGFTKTRRGALPTFGELIDQQRNFLTILAENAKRVFRRIALSSDTEFQVLSRATRTREANGVRLPAAPGLEREVFSPDEVGAGISKSMRSRQHGGQ